MMQNDLYDEALELSGDSVEEKKKETVMTNDLYDEAHDLDDSEGSIDTSDGRTEPEEKKQPETKKPVVDEKDDESEESEEDDEEEGSPVERRVKIEGQYNPADYKDLHVSSDIKDLFQYISRYNPHDVDLESTLKCFVPDYIPAVGEMDPFIKVPRPDGEKDTLGLTVLDEPAAAQSDATVLELQLRAVSKKHHHGEIAVRSIENAAKSPLDIDRWINSIADLHRSKPQPQIHFRKPMPDIEKLMEEWPPNVEDLLRSPNFQLPSADLEASLPEFTRLVCGILDVPIYDNLVESLHLCFSLYLEFLEHPHFAHRITGGGGVQQQQDAKFAADAKYSSGDAK